MAKFALDLKSVPPKLRVAAGCLAIGSVVLVLSRMIIIIPTGKVGILSSQGLTREILQLRAIEATEKLAQSQNAKVVIVGGETAPVVRLETGE